RHQKQNGKLPIKLFLVDGSEHSHKGSIDFISPKVDPNTGTITVRITFPNPDKSLRPGQFANVDVQLEDQSDVLTVPEEAVQQDQVGSFVLTVAENGTVALKRVKAGRRYKGVRVIEEGLNPGEQVVTKGQERVRAGSKVQIDVKKSQKTGEASGG
ncbi:MAG: efflux RND transporter periplasmic adaptor subunit, partial [Hyphomicrobiales bacterium]